MIYFIDILLVLLVIYFIYLNKKSWKQELKSIDYYINKHSFVPKKEMFISGIYQEVYKDTECVVCIIDVAMMPSYNMILECYNITLNQTFFLQCPYSFAKGRLQYDNWFFVFGSNDYSSMTSHMFKFKEIIE